MEPRFARSFDASARLAPGMISDDAWAALCMLGILASGPASSGEIEERAALDVLTVLPLLEMLESDGLVRQADGFYRLAAAPAAIPVAAILRAVDGDILYQRPDDDGQAPEIATLQRRLTAAIAVILDNFSLAEAIDASEGERPCAGALVL